MSLTDFLFPEHYGVFAAQPFSKSFKFLLKLVLLITVVFTATISLEIYAGMPKAEQWVSRTIESLSTELPVIEITDGKLVKPDAQFVRNFGGFAFIIEPDKAKAPALLMEQKEGAVLTQDSLMIKSERRRGDPDIKIHELKDLKYLRITGVPHALSIEWQKGKAAEWTGEKAVGRMRLLSRFLVPLLLVVIFPCWLAVKLAQVLLFSVGGMAFNSLLKAGLSYKELVNLGIYALLPPTIVALLVIRLAIPMFPLIFMAIYFFYLYSGIRAAAAAKTVVP